MVRLARPKLSTPLAAAAPVAVTEALSSGGSSSHDLAVLLLLLLGLALLLLVTAITPARALPRQVDTFLDGRRVTIAFTAECVLLAFMIVLLIANAGS